MEFDVKLDNESWRTQLIITHKLDAFLKAKIDISNTDGQVYSATIYTDPSFSEYTALAKLSNSELEVRAAKIFKDALVAGTLSKTIKTGLRPILNWRMET